MGECTEIDCEKPEDRDGLCFRHRVCGVSFNWVGGGGYGRKAFSSGTVKEFTDDIERSAAAKGQEIRKLSTRAELI